jgi:hypothetical protein
MTHRFILLMHFRRIRFQGSLTEIKLQKIELVAKSKYQVGQMESSLRTTGDGT